MVAALPSLLAPRPGRTQLIAPTSQSQPPTQQTDMAQGKMSEAGAGASLGLEARAVPEAAATAYGGTGSVRLVLLAKPLPGCAGYGPPFAVVRLDDLPEELRHQIVGGGGQGASAWPRGSNAPAAAPACGEAASRHLQLLHAALHVVSDGPHRQLAGEEGVTDAKVGAFYDNGLTVTAPENADNHLPAPDYSSSVLVSPLEDDAVPFVETLLGNNRAAELGTHYYYCCYYRHMLLPSPENIMPTVAGEAFRGSRSPTYSVQVSVDAAARAKAGDPIAVGVKAAADADAGRGHGDLSAVVGIVAASSAATALAAGAVGPVTAFGLFALLLGGLSLAMASVRAL